MFATWRRRIAVAAFAIVIVAGMTYGLWPRPVAVDLASVARGPLEVTVNEEGVTRIRDVYVISAPVAGRLERSPRHVGDPVEAGRTVVAVIRPTPPAFLDERGRREAEARVRAAEAAEQLGAAEVLRATAELEFATSELARAERLAASATISTRALEEARLNVQVNAAAVAKAQADLAVRRQELASAQARLIEPGQSENGTAGSECCVNVRAPIDGTVLKIISESEQIVVAGTPLLEIGDPTHLEITVDLLSSDAVKIRAGALAHIERWGGADILAAAVRRVDPAGFTKVSALGIEEQRVKVTLDPAGDMGVWSSLGHDYRIYARIVIWSGEDVLQVPLSALFRHGDAWAVFAVEDGRARRTAVEIGMRNDRSAQLVSGLEAGARVIVHPSDRVDDGVAVIGRDVSAP